MVRDIPYSETTGDPASVEGRQDGEQSVASHNPCDARGQISAVLPETEVVPPPSVCSTAVGGAACGGAACWLISVCTYHRKRSSVEYRARSR